jgi:nicotinate dehydrogenase subunit A
MALDCGDMEDAGQPSSRIELVVNGRRQAVDVDPATPLLYVLADELHLRGPKFGCGLGQCGACTALVGGRAVRSCVTPVAAVRGQDIVTLEGLGTPERPHPLQQAFIDEQAAQCGFCLNGVILSAKAVLDARPEATEAELRQALDGVLCRCFAHLRMFKALQRYRQGLRA